MVIGTSIVSKIFIFVNLTAQDIDWGTFSGNYSIEEQDTGYTWITGDRIYKKLSLYHSRTPGTRLKSPTGLLTLKHILKPKE